MINLSIFWTILIILFILIEAITLQLLAIWFVIGSMVALILNLLGFTMIFQIILFLVVNVIVVFIVRPIVNKYINLGFDDQDVNSIIGKVGVVVTDIQRDQTGLVKVDGKTWKGKTAKNKTISKGREIKVIAIEGTNLIVKKIH